MVTDGAIIWSQNENIRRNTKILKSKTKKKNRFAAMETTKKDAAALWIISVSAYLYTSLRTEASCTSVDKKSMAQSSSSSLHNRNQTTFSSNEKFARKSYFYFFRHFFPFSSFLTLFMFNIGNVISKNPVFPEHTSCITHICIYKFHRKTFEK